MFGRSNYAVFGIEPSTIEAFQKSLSDPLTLFKVSQLAASITTKFQDKPQTGINPFGNPRLDEKLTDAKTISELSVLLKKKDDDTEYTPTPEDIELVSENQQYMGVEADFSLGNNKYGLWLIFNEYEDPTDPSSKKEQMAYTEMERPFKFLVKDEKKVIEERVMATSILNRSQFPVLIDFQHGRVYVESANKDEVTAVQELLIKLGAKVFPLVWDFGYPFWPVQFLNKIAKETHFASAMKTRADELSRFKSDEVEKLEDKQLEKIVSTFFALSELESELWVGLTTPARIRIHTPIDPVGVSNPSVAFSLLNMSNDAQVATSSVVFQEVVIRNTKNGEKIFRNNLFTIDINDNVNIQEAGAAMLRGFDLPQFKKEVKTTIKAKNHISITDYWSMWLQAMHDAVLMFTDNVTDVLGVNKEKCGLVVPDYSDSEDVEVGVDNN
jgi:hypothetical protein